MDRTAEAMQVIAVMRYCLSTPQKRELLDEVMTLLNYVGAQDIVDESDLGKMYALRLLAIVETEAASLAALRSYFTRHMPRLFAVETSFDPSSLLLDIAPELS